MKVKVFILLLFFLKFCLDFLSPFRDLNFVLFNVVCIAFLFFKKEALSLIAAKEWLAILCFFMFCCLWLIVGREFQYFAKYCSLILIYIVVKSCIHYMSISDLKVLVSRSLKLFIFLFSSNYAVSLLIASPLHRDFYNFEHANLLGSYILTSLIFVYILILVGERRAKFRMSVILASAISTSTGSFLASLCTLINVKKVNSRNVLLIVILALFIICLLYYTTSVFAPELFIKIFGPFQLLLSGGWEELVILSKHRLAMQDLGEEYQSSLVWRFYAYLIFLEAKFSQSLLEFLFGSGFWGFAKVWDGIAPHNDFILIFIDFGLIGLLVFSYYFIRSFVWSLRFKPVLLPLYIILALRLLFENNIYSYYLMSTLVMNITLLYFSLKKIR